MVGCNYLYAFAPNLRSRESRRCRHVARVVRDIGELGWIRTVTTPNAEPRSGGLGPRPPWAIWKSHFLVFYLALALGFLAKGPIAWTPLLTIAVVIIYTREWQLFRRFKFVGGILLTLVVVALWGIPALVQTRAEFFRVGIGRHVLTRSFMTLEGHGASSFGMYVLLLPFYFVTVFISFFPWSIKLPWLIRKLWRNREAGVIHLRQGYGGQAAAGYSGSPIDIYLLSSIAIIFVIFTLVSTKLPHYTLPAFPLLALLLARHWHQGAAVESRRFPFTTIAIATACFLVDRSCPCGSDDDSAVFPGVSAL